jgi:urease accessory protein
VVSRAYATSPLRLLTPRNHGHAAWVYTSSYGGGLVDGDRIAMQIEVGAGAAAFVSTQASTKVYRSIVGTSAELAARVNPGGLLIVAPDPVVCFATSRYRPVQRFNVAEDASLVLIDWLSSGRRAFGERWQFDEYASETVVLVNEKLVVHDALALRANDGNLAERLGRFDVLATLAVIGVPLRGEAAAIAAAVGETPVTRRPEQLIVATQVADAGCMVRIAGASVEQVGHTLRALLGFVPALLGDDPWSRKW